MFKLLLTLMLFSSTAYAKVDCKVHKIYCKIVKLNPSIDTEFAFELSNLLYKKAKEYGTDPMVSVAIAMQESSLRNINRTTQGYLEKDCDSTHQKSAMCVVPVVTDIGIFQIHVYTAKNYGFNMESLMTDIEYQVDSHLKILKQKLKNCRHLGKEAWSCYHSTTPKYRLKYVKDVSRYL